MTRRRSAGQDGLRSAFADEQRSPGLLLWQVTHRWQAAQRAALAPSGLTHVQFVLLAWLVHWRTGLGGGGVTQRQLATAAATDPMMTSQVLRALETKGLVRRPPHPQDRRARAVEATEEGHRLARSAVQAVEATDAAFFAPLGAAGARQLAEDLARLVPEASSTRGSGCP